MAMGNTGASLPLGLLLLLCGLLLSGCNLGYYGQAVSGHLEIQRKTKPIGRLLQDKSTPPELRQQLSGFVAMRHFARDRLHLPDQGSYRSYADLGRPFVTWMLIATPEFSLEPRRWCFPFVGCLPYQGLFHEAEAQAQAKALKAQGMDVKVAGSPAYSSLGWFKDPLLNTMLRTEDIRLAETLFHELAHQKLYFKHDTAFNEAFASAIAQHGVTLWLQSADRSRALNDYHQALQRRTDLYQLSQRTHARLQQLYATSTDQGAMRQQKAAIFRQMQAEYQTLKQAWGGHDGYDAFMAQALNNAHLALLSTYQELTPAFLRRIEDCQGSLTGFYRLVDGWKGLSPQERRHRLEQSGCGEEGHPTAAQRQASSSMTLWASNL